MDGKRGLALEKEEIAKVKGQVQGVVDGLTLLR